MKSELQAIATILSLVNPAMCAAIFLESRADAPSRGRVADAAKAVAAITAVLLVAALAGTNILNVFGVSLSAFSCAGGGILVWIGVRMLSSSETSRKQDESRTADGASSLAPLILFAASPGTITGVITVSASHSKLGLPTTAIVAITVTAVVLLMVLMGAARFGGGRGEGGLLRSMVTSYMGLIVIAMGIQFALTGFKEFMSGS